VSMRGLLVIAGLLALPGAAFAEQTDYSAGKTPAQLFSGDCSACHQSPRGLAKGKDQGSLAGFLREHYTTKAETAGALAAYLLSNPGPAPDPRGRQRGTPERSTPASAPAAAQAPKPAEQDPLFRRIFGSPAAEPEQAGDGAIATPEPGEGASNARQKGKPRTATRPGAERSPAEAAKEKEKARELAKEKEKEKEAVRESAKESAKEAAKPKKPDPAEVAKAEAAKAEEAAREAAAKEAAARAEAAKAEAAKVRAYVTGGEAAPPPEKPPG